jgi:thymidine kinase
MAKLYFYYSAMNAGKTTTLLQSAYNYHERGMRTRILTPMLDNRAGERCGGVAHWPARERHALCPRR